MSSVGAFGGGGGGVSGEFFKTYQVDLGDSVVADVANDVITFTSSDNSVDITGNAGTKTIDFTVNFPAAGDVDGPASSTDNAICRFDSTTGKLIQNSASTMDDSGNIVLPSTGAVYFGPTGDNFRIIRLTTALWLYGNQGGAGFGLDSNGYYFNRPLPLYFGNQSASGLDEQILIKDAAGGQLGGGQNFLIRAMNQANTGANSHGGGVKIYGGDQTNASASANGGSVTLKGGDVTNTGTGGGVNIQEGTSGAGTRGTIAIGRTASSSIIRLNSRVQAAASDALTLANGPAGTAGDPDVFLKLNINGTDYVFPGWAI